VQGIIATALRWYRNGRNKKMVGNPERKKSFSKNKIILLKPKSIVKKVWNL